MLRLHLTTCSPILLTMKQLRDIRVGTRLSIGFALILALSLATALMGLSRLATLAESVQSMMEEPLAKERFAEEWYRYIYAGSRRTSAIAKSSDPSLEAFFEEDAKLSNARGNELQRALELRLYSDEELIFFETLNKKRQAYVAARKEVYALKAAGDVTMAGALLDKEFLPASQAYLAAMDEFVGYQRRHIDATALAIQNAYTKSKFILVVLILGAIVVSLASAILLTRSIVRPLRTAADAIANIADGNLTIISRRAPGKDELGRLLSMLEEMRIALAAKIERVRSGTSTISVAANQIAAGNLDLSSRTERQASTLETTARSMDAYTDRDAKCSECR
jgi:methyl-accepting chemotaxis protein